MIFYRNLLGAAFEIAPDEAMRAVCDVMTTFQMPGHGIENFSRKSVQIAMAGIYDLRIHHDEVVTPMLRNLKALRDRGPLRRRREGARRARRLPVRTGPAGDPVHRARGKPCSPPERSVPYRRPDDPAKAIRQARVAVSLVFAVHGAVVGTFATRIPWVADHAHASPGALGVALIAPALGAVTTMPLAANLTAPIPQPGDGARPAPRLVRLPCATGIGAERPPLFGALLISGATAGMADVAMNAQGVVVEQRYGRSIMSSLHGLWSAGGLVASGIGALAAYANIDARVHFGVAAVVLAVVGWFACRGLLDVRLPSDGTPAFALPSRPVLLIGLVGFCAVFAEGGSIDWCAVYVERVTGAGPGVAASAFTAFAFAMTGGRLVGDHVVRRLGPVATVRLGGLIAAAGGVLVLLAREPAPAIAGFAFIGLGVSVVVPLAFAAAGNTGVNPGRAIAGVATIAYGSGLAAPGIIGGIAQVSSLSVSFAVVALLCVGIALGGGALRPRRPALSGPLPTQSAAASKP